MAIAFVIGVLAALNPWARSNAAAVPSTDDLDIVFTAIQRGEGHRRIFRADGDGSNIRPITPPNDLDYSWATWAFNGSKVVFTARNGPEGSPENIFMMNPDATGGVQLTSATWRLAQPKVSPDGRTLVFSALWEEFDFGALYSLDLSTLQVTNLSALNNTLGAIDADPRWTPDGRQIVFIDAARKKDTAQTWIMNADGSNRKILLDTEFSDTDPVVSPDGKTLAVASYRGEGTLSAADPEDRFRVKLNDFFLVTKPVAGGAETVLNRGLECYTHDDDDRCHPSEGSAYVPLWTPDGRGIGFVSALSSARVCICLATPDGQFRTVLESTDLTIDWFDWVKAGQRPAPATEIGAERPASQLLFTMTNAAGDEILATSDPDRFVARPIIPHSRVVPRTARWTPDRSHIVFTALASPDGTGGMAPAKAVTGRDPIAAPAAAVAPPPGTQRSVHFTLELLEGMLQESVSPPADGTTEQIFIMKADGSDVRQLTAPWTEDYMDGIPDGEARSNGDPELSPDGRYMYFTNRSTVGHESFILRMDLRTGAVMNLTNATAGAVPTADSSPRLSPDGKSLAFVAAVGDTLQVMLMSALDGSGVVQVTDDDYVNLHPSWSPDGRSLVFSSYRGKESGSAWLAVDPETGARSLPTDGWHLVRHDVASAAQTLLNAKGGTPMLLPQWAPDGTSVRYVGTSAPGQPDLYDIASSGGRPRPVQVTQKSQEVFFDWR